MLLYFKKEQLQAIVIYSKEIPVDMCVVDIDLNYNNLTISMDKNTITTSILPVCFKGQFHNTKYSLVFFAKQMVDAVYHVTYYTTDNLIIPHLLVTLNADITDGEIDICDLINRIVNY
jgi:hypothetical protein